MERAPLLLDHLDAEDAEHFAEVRALLDAAGVAYEIDPTLVRGLDYYTRTVFEFTSDALGAQSGVGGGGRYDGLAEQLGGPPTPGIGWAAGVERILLAGEHERPAPEAVVRPVRRRAPRVRRRSRLAAEARRAGLAAQMELAGPLAQGPAQAGRPAPARATSPIFARTRDHLEGHGERRAGGAGGRRRSSPRVLRGRHIG